MMTSKCHEKRDLIHQIKKMNSKVIASSHVKGLCYQIGKLTKNLNDVMTTNEKNCQQVVDCEKCQLQSGKLYYCLGKNIGKG